MENFSVSIPKNNGYYCVDSVNVHFGVTFEWNEYLLITDSAVATEKEYISIINSAISNGIEQCLHDEDFRFSFVLIDKLRHIIWYVRDSFGETSAMYQETDSKLIVSSSLSSFKPSSKNVEIDIDALNLYLALTYIPAPYTIYKGIRKLLPGEIITIHNNVFDRKIYYDLEHAIQSAPVSNAETTSDHINKQVRTSIDRYSSSSCGCFLSGGIDSSIVSCVYGQSKNTPIETFSIGFNNKEYDESDRADIVVKHIKSIHHLYKLGFDDVDEHIDTIIRLYEEPFSDSSSIPSFFVAKMAADAGMSVALTGDCADELFGGYSKYLVGYYVEKYNRYPTLIKSIIKWLVERLPVTNQTDRILRKVKKVLRNVDKAPGERYCDLMSLGFPKAQRSRLLSRKYYRQPENELIINNFNRLPSCLSELQKSQIMDVKIVLEGDMFPKMRRVCRQHNLINVSPFISKRMVIEAIRLSDADKIRKSTGKYVLREAFKANLPLETLTKPKRGFSAPVDDWLRKGMKSELLDLLSEDRIQQQGIFNFDYVSLLLQEHFSHKNNNYSQLYCLFVFQKWYYECYLGNR